MIWGEIETGWNPIISTHMKPGDMGVDSSKFPFSRLFVVVVQKLVILAIFLWIGFDQSTKSSAKLEISVGEIFEIFEIFENFISWHYSSNNLLNFQQHFIFPVIFILPYK
jgi:hypothetical protein